MESYDTEKSRIRKFKAGKNPSLVRHTRDYFLQELQAWGGLIRGEWPWLLMLIAGVTVLLAFTRPLPPKDVYLAVGQSGSTFEALGNKFVPYFAEQGITLHIVNTSGSEHSLADLDNVNNTVSAALMVGGLASKDQYPRLVSLGSIEYAPLWLFYRGQTSKNDALVSPLSAKRIAVGPVGSGTTILLKRILALSEVSLDEHENFIKMPNKEAVQKLIDGDLDAVFLLDGFNSPNVQKLISRHDIEIYDFSYAPAIVKKLPYMDSVVIPKGSLDLKDLLPTNDVHMLSSTATLLIEKNMHPAIQHIFLLSAEKISRDVNQFFARPGYFPAYVDHSMPLSQVATRYYENGAPALKDDLPLWLVSYLDRMWILLVGAFAVIYPFFKLFPSYRHTRAIMLISDAYEELLGIEQQAARTDRPEALQDLIDRLEEINADSRHISISSDEISRLYSMKSAVNMVHAQLVEKMKRLA